MLCSDLCLMHYCNQITFFSSAVTHYCSKSSIHVTVTIMSFLALQTFFSSARRQTGCKTVRMTFCSKMKLTLYTSNHK